MGGAFSWNEMDEQSLYIGHPLCSIAGHLVNRVLGEDLAR
jgi:hypothetical protein